MNRVAVFAALVALAAVAAAVPLDSSRDVVPLLTHEDAVPEIYIAVLHNQVPDSALKALAQQYSARHVYNIGGTFKAFSVKMDEAQLSNLRLRSDVLRYIAQDSRVYAFAVQTNPPSWGIDRIDQRQLPLDTNYTYPDAAGSSSTVYILDTGIRITHQEFAGRARWGATFTGDGDQDGHGHGTHCAGTAAGTTTGVAKHANLVAVKVLGNSGSGSWEGVAAGLNWMVDDCANPSQCVGSMSLGGGGNQVADDAVNAAVTAGVTVAVAAGNNANDACYYSPARAALATTVGATDINDNRASYSNFGTCMEIFAPGSNIYSSYIGSDSSYTSMSGTSMACPHVAGAVALLQTQHPGSTPAQIVSYLQSQGTPNVVGNAGANSPNILLYTDETM